MKLITMLMLALCLTLSFGCSKDKVETAINDAKIKTADTIGAAVEKELKEAYVGVAVEGADCEAEAVKIGGLTSDKVKDFLKVKEEQSLTQKSVAGSVLPGVCNYVVSSVFPELINDIKSDYVCLKAAGAVKISKVGKDLCSAIDI